MKDLPFNTDEHGLLLFDGICGLCNSSVMFIANRDRNGYILYASLQSDLGQQVLNEFGFPTNYIDSLLFLDKGKLYTRSDASVQVAHYFSRFWRLLHFIKYIPKPIRDFGYKLISKYRYSIFGRVDVCPLPDSKISSRILAA